MPPRESRLVPTNAASSDTAFGAGGMCEGGRIGEMTQFHDPKFRGRRLVQMVSLATAALILAGCGGGSDAPTEIPAESNEATINVQAEPAPVEEFEQPEVAIAEPAPLPPAPVATTAAAPAPAQLDSSDWILPPPFYAAGDEPYWRLDIIDEWFVFSRAGLPAIEAPLTAPARDGEVDIFEAGPLSIHVARKTCRTADGENSRYATTVWFDDVSFEGCGFEGQSAGTSAEATAVVDSIRAVDSCLSGLGDPALVTGIYQRGDRQTALGMRTRDGRLFECVTELGGSAVAFLDQVEPGAAGPWMTSGMRFLRAGQGRAACDDAEVVTNGDAVLGHLLVETCRF